MFKTKPLDVAIEGSQLMAYFSAPLYFFVEDLEEGGKMPIVDGRAMTRQEWSELVKQVWYWFDAMGDDRVNEFNESLEAQKNKQSEEWREWSKNNQKDGRTGEVYLIRSSDGLYKIGRSKDARARFDNMKGGSSTALFIECIVKSDDMFALEDELQNRFATNCVHHEWYKLTLEDVEYIKGLADG